MWTLESKKRLFEALNAFKAALANKWQSLNITSTFSTFLFKSLNVSIFFKKTYLDLSGIIGLQYCHSAINYFDCHGSCEQYYVEENKKDSVTLSGLKLCQRQQDEGSQERGRQGGR
jgi:hypothetical protein